MFRQLLLILALSVMVQSSLAAAKWLEVGDDISIEGKMQLYFQYIETDAYKVIQIQVTKNEEGAETPYEVTLSEVSFYPDGRDSLVTHQNTASSQFRRTKKIEDIEVSETQIRFTVNELGASYTVEVKRGKQISLEQPMLRLSDQRGESLPDALYDCTLVMSTLKKPMEWRSVDNILLPRRDIRPAPEYPRVEPPPPVERGRPEPYDPYAPLPSY